MRHVFIAVAIVAAIVSPVLAQLSVDSSVPPLYLVTSVKTEAFSGFSGSEAQRVGQAAMDELLASLARNDEPGKLTTPWRLIPVDGRQRQPVPSGALVTVSLATDRATVRDEERTDVGPTVFETLLGRRRTTYSSSSEVKSRDEVRLFRFSLRATRPDGTLLLAWEVPIFVADHGVDLSRVRFRIGDYRYGHSRRGQSDVVALLRDADVPLQAAAELHAVLVRWWNDPTIGADALGAAVPTFSPATQPSAAPVPASIRASALRARVTLQPPVKRVLDAGGYFSHVSVGDPITGQVVDPHPYYERIGDSVRIFYHDKLSRRAEDLVFNVTAEP